MFNWQRFYGSVLSEPEDVARLEEFDRLTGPVTLVWADGLSTRLTPGEQLSRVLYVSGTYEPNTLCVLRRHLRPGAVFVDGGAHAGVFSLAASRWVGAAGRVYAVEPSEREYRRLLESLSLSRAANVVPIRAALGAAAGRGLLRIAETSYSGLNSMGARFAYDGVPEAASEAVEIVTIDDLVRRSAIGRVDAVKLDIEGGEADALAGATQVLRRFRPTVVLELNVTALGASGAATSDLEQLAVDAGYRPFAIDDSDASLTPVAGLAGLDGQNLVLLPRERACESP